MGPSINPTWQVMNICGSGVIILSLVSCIPALDPELHLQHNDPDIFQGPDNYIPVPRALGISQTDEAFERVVRAPMRFGKRTPLRFGKREMTGPKEKRAPMRFGKREGGVEDFDLMKRAPMRFGKRQPSWEDVEMDKRAPMRFGKRQLEMDEMDVLKRAPMRFGKRSEDYEIEKRAPMRFGKRYMDLFETEDKRAPMRFGKRDAMYDDY